MSDAHAMAERMVPLPPPALLAAPHSLPDGRSPLRLLMLLLLLLLLLLIFHPIFSKWARALAMSCPTTSSTTGLRLPQLTSRK